jgi:hypothetical protein
VRLIVFAGDVDRGRRFCLARSSIVPQGRRVVGRSDQDTVIRAVEDAKRVLNIFQPGQRHAVRTAGGVA